MKHFLFSLRKIGPFQIITSSFLALILLGSLLLFIPAARSGGGSCSYLDALFTSCSAVCVTGLVVHNTATFWSFFGRGVILVLIQIGGLGVITVVIAVSLITGKRIGLRQRNLMQNAVNAPKIGGIIKFTRFLLIFTVLTELCGAVLLVPAFGHRYGLIGGIRKAVFHAVSAFCNAGFDILGDKTPYASLTGYQNNAVVNIVIMLLIIAGGIGFLTWDDMIRGKLRIKKMALQTKLILMTSGLLIVIPAILFFFFEFKTGGIGNRLLLSFFQSVTTRTAGFNTADIGAMSDRAKLIMIGLMLIGGSPGSTAGGLKTTTFAVIVLSASQYTRQRKNVSVMGRSLSMDVILNAFTLLVLYSLLFLSGSLLISVIEQLPVMDCMFECASALGTVGLTVGITPSLSAASKVILICFMYFGRVGGLTLAYAALSGDHGGAGRFPEEKVMIG